MRQVLQPMWTWAGLTEKSWKCRRSGWMNASTVAAIVNPVRTGEK